MEAVKMALCKEDFRSVLGPCMITFAIPLLIPGITLTLVAFQAKSGFSKYGVLHVMGMILLGVSGLLLIMGCIFKCTATKGQGRVSPLDEDGNLSSSSVRRGVDPRHFFQFKNTQDALIAQPKQTVSTKESRTLLNGLSASASKSDLQVPIKCVLTENPLSSPGMSTANPEPSTISRQQQTSKNNSKSSSATSLCSSRESSSDTIADVSRPNPASSGLKEIHYVTMSRITTVETFRSTPAGQSCDAEQASDSNLIHSSLRVVTAAVCLNSERVESDGGSPQLNTEWLQRGGEPGSQIQEECQEDADECSRCIVMRDGLTVRNPSQQSLGWTVNQAEEGRGLRGFQGSRSCALDHESSSCQSSSDGTYSVNSVRSEELLDLKETYLEIFLHQEQNVLQSQQSFVPPVSPVPLPADNSCPTAKRQNPLRTDSNNSRRTGGEQGVTLPLRADSNSSYRTGVEQGVTLPLRADSNNSCRTGDKQGVTHSLRADSNNSCRTGDKQGVTHSLRADSNNSCRTGDKQGVTHSLRADSNNSCRTGGEQGVTLPLRADSNNSCRTGDKQGVTHSLRADSNNSCRTGDKQGVTHSLRADSNNSCRTGGEQGVTLPLRADSNSSYRTGDNQGVTLSLRADCNNSYRTGGEQSITALTMPFRAQSNNSWQTANEHKVTDVTAPLKTDASNSWGTEGEQYVIDLDKASSNASKPAAFETESSQSKHTFLAGRSLKSGTNDPLYQDVMAETKTRRKKTKKNKKKKDDSHSEYKPEAETG